jgi:hypothetical protein
MAPADGTVSSMATTLPTSAVELDQRTNDGIDVRLLWSPDDGRVFVAVSDSRTGEAFALEVAERSRALDVFHHPYAYAGGGGLATALSEAAAP